MNVVIIILNWRNSIDTLACIESLLGLGYRKFKIVVCDNSSSDGSLEDFLDWSAENPDVAAQNFISLESEDNAIRDAFVNRVVWIQTGANLGFAGGNNVGIRLALKLGGVDFFWLLNNDCVVAGDSLSYLCQYMTTHPDVGICGAKVIYFHSPDRVQAYGGASHDKWTGRAHYLGHLSHPDDPHDSVIVENQLSYVAGASMFVRREFVERVGLMHEDYFLYFEEIDWALRGKGIFRLGYEPKAIVFHKEGGTIGSSSDTRKTSRLSDFYLFRNRLRFTRRFFPEALPSVWLVMLLQGIRRGLRGQFERMWLIFQILAGKQHL
ncbi:glycosyltransferase family 2 protein [Methyloversatilis discipulorum]|uniref:glycosyltransferase family 2 protein n=1 Tax=Methyloversatilis discipulorum TaxID=1119528 RepID=UPI0009DA853B|nr:glycosyltransferase family 2 protein [Methyloversatilis discipulorum]